MDFDLATELALSSGGDSRLTVDAAHRLNRYGCRFAPEPDILHMGSCTASTISEPAFDAARTLLSQLNCAERPPAEHATEAIHEQIRRGIAEHLVESGNVAVDVVLTPSGTDAEFVPLAIVAKLTGKRIRNIVTAYDEVGSGTTEAAAGQHFDPLTPKGVSAVPGRPASGDLAAVTEMVPVGVRTAGGGIRGADEIDADVRRLAEEGLAEGKAVVVHVVAHSKTGVHAPSLELVRGLQRAAPASVHVVIDAAQGRISRRGLRSAMELGDMLILTGSKFYGGPPFAGAVLVPERYLDLAHTSFGAPVGLHRYFTAEQAPRSWTRWRESLPRSGNVGLLLRWQAALAEIEHYYAIEPQVRLDVLRAFERIVPECLAGADGYEPEHTSPPVIDDSVERLLESKQTVFSFVVRTPRGQRLDADGLRRVQRIARVPPRSGSIPAVQVGQPVVVSTSGEAMLRIALGGPLMRRYADAVDLVGSIRRDVCVVLERLTDAAARVDEVQ